MAASSNTVIWRTNDQNRWGLYTHTDYKLPSIQDQATDEKTDKQKSKTTSDTPFYTTKLKQEMKGTMISTPIGYGIIQSIDPVKNIMAVKVQGVVHDFDRNEISNEVPILITFLRNSLKMEQKMYMSVSSTIKELFERLEASFDNGNDMQDIKLFLLGKELEKSDDTFEKLKITPNTKFLATCSQGKPLSMNRFTSCCSGWCVGGNGVDGISFQTSKNIRIIGFGIYPGTSQENLAGTGKLFEGDSTKGTMLCSVDVEMTKAQSIHDNTPLRVMFGKPYALKAGGFYSLTVSFVNSGNSYYGNGGKIKVEGEGDVTFTFKNCEGAHNGTGTGSGQIPEIYYYL